MAEPAPSRMTIAEFFAWQERQDELYELVDGVPVPRAMTGATRRHDRIVVRALVALGGRLRGGPCEPHTADVGVRTISALRRPDLTVDCGSFAPDAVVSEAPVLVLEVLSPSTSNMDRIIKVEEYKRLPTLRYILIADPVRPAVLLHARDGSGAWTAVTHIGLDSVLDLPRLGCSLPLSDLYEDMVGPDAPAPAATPA